jgi:hypothetical protein
MKDVFAYANMLIKVVPGCRMANVLGASPMANVFEKTLLNGANLLGGALFGINPERPGLFFYPALL